MRRLSLKVSLSYSSRNARRSRAHPTASRSSCAPRRRQRAESEGRPARPDRRHLMHFMARHGPLRCRGPRRGGAAARRRGGAKRVQLVRGMDEACPVSTGGGTRRVHLVREGGGGGGAEGPALRAIGCAARTPAQRARRQLTDPHAARRQLTDPHAARRQLTDPHAARYGPRAVLGSVRMRRGAGEREHSRASGRGNSRRGGGGPCARLAHGLHLLREDGLERVRVAHRLLPERAVRQRRVQFVRRDGRDVSTLYGREGGGGPPRAWRSSAAPPGAPRPSRPYQPRSARAPRATSGVSPPPSYCSPYHSPYCTLSLPLLPPLPYCSPYHSPYCTLSLPLLPPLPYCSPYHSPYCTLSLPLLPPLPYCSPYHSPYCTLSRARRAAPHLLQLAKLLALRARAHLRRDRVRPRAVELRPKQPDVPAQRQHFHASRGRARLRTVPPARRARCRRAVRRRRRRPAPLVRLRPPARVGAECHPPPPPSLLLPLLMSLLYTPSVDNS